MWGAVLFPAALAPRKNTPGNRCDSGNIAGIVGDWDGGIGVLLTEATPFKNVFIFPVSRAMRSVFRVRIFGYTPGDFGLPVAGLTIIFSLLYSTHDVEFKDTHERTVTIRNGVSPSIRLLGGFFMPRAWEPKRSIVDN